MISSRTKEALARKKSEGKRLGRPKGKLSATTKLTGKDDLIREYLDKKIPVSVIARLLNVHRLLSETTSAPASFRNLPLRNCKVRYNLLATTKRLFALCAVVLLVVASLATRLLLRGGKQARTLLQRGANLSGLPLVPFRRHDLAAFILNPVLCARRKLFEGPWTDAACSTVVYHVPSFGTVSTLPCSRRRIRNRIASSFLRAAAPMLRISARRTL